MARTTFQQALKDRINEQNAAFRSGDKAKLDAAKQATAAAEKNAMAAGAVAAGTQSQPAQSKPSTSGGGADKAPTTQQVKPAVSSPASVPSVQPVAQSVSKDKPVVTQNKIPTMADALAKYAGQMKTFSSSEKGTYSKKFEDMTPFERSAFLREKDKDTYGDGQAVRVSDESGGTFNGVGYAYKDEYGFEHVSNDLATALSYSKDGDVQQYSGKFGGGYGLDSSGERGSLGMSGSNPYGNVGDKPGQQPSIQAASGKLTPLGEALQQRKQQVANGSNPASNPGAGPAANPAVPETSKMSTADQEAISLLGSRFNSAKTEDEKVGANRAANDIRKRYGIAPQVYTPQTASQAPVPSSAGFVPQNLSNSPVVAQSGGGNYDQRENSTTQSNTSTDFAADWQYASQHGDLAGMRKALDARGIKISSYGDNVTQEMLDSQAQMEGITRDLEEKAKADNPNSADAILEKMTEALEPDAETKAITDKLTAGYTPTAVDAPTTFAEALNLAKSILDPKYDNARKERTDAVYKDQLARGFAGQLPGMAQIMDETGKLENQRASDVASMAQDIVGKSKDEAFRKATFESSEKQAGLNQLLAALNAKNATTSQKATLYSALLDYANQRETAKQNQANADRNYKLQVADMTGVLDGQQTLTFKNMLFNQGITQGEYDMARQKHGKEMDQMDQELKNLQLAYQKAKSSGTTSGALKAATIAQQLQAVNMALEAAVSYDGLGNKTGIDQDKMTATFQMIMNMVNGGTPQ